jgi:hypothetical protein
MDPVLVTRIAQQLAESVLLDKHMVHGLFSQRFSESAG